MLASALVLTGCVMPGYIPTPDMSVSFNPSSDTREWQPQFMDANLSGFIMELVPAGDSIKSWKEMVAQQTVFTPAGLNEYIATWELGLINADADIELQKTTNADGSITIDYSSNKANESGIRRFIKGSDGIYMIAYHVRPQYKDSSKTAIWSKIIAEAKLVPNPAK